MYKNQGEDHSYCYANEYNIRLEDDLTKGIRMKDINNWETPTGSSHTMLKVQGYGCRLVQSEDHRYCTSCIDSNRTESTQEDERKL